MFQISWMLKRNEKNKMKWKNYCFYKLMLTNAEILFVCKLSLPYLTFGVDVTRRQTIQR